MPPRSAGQGLALMGRLLLWTALCSLILYPLVMVVIAALAPALLAQPAIQLADLFTARYLSAWGNTLRLGVAVALLSLVLGGGLAFLAAQTARAGWIDLMMTVPFLTPPFLASLAWGLAVGPRGYLSRFALPGAAAEALLFSFWGMAALMAAHYAPLVYFALRSQIAKTSTSLFWAAQLSGASAGRIVLTIFLPLTRPALLAGGFLAFSSAIEEYGTPLVIGNRIGFPVIATEIGRLVSVYPINLTLASGLASTLLLLAGSLYFLSHLAQRSARAAPNASARALPNLLTPSARVALWCLVGFYAILAVAIPYTSMLLTSMLKLVSVGPTLANLTLANYLQGLSAEAGGLREALVTSVFLALFAAAIGTMLGAGAAREGKALTILALVPLAMPAITMAVGFIRGWNAPWAAPLPLYATVWIVGLFYTAQFLPYAVQYARAGLAALPPSYEWAARVHGASRARTLTRIVAPLLLPHALGGAILIFSIAFRELVGSVLLRPPGVDTVSTFILREFDQGSPAVGMAMGMIAIVVALVGITLARRLVPQKV